MVEFIEFWLNDSFSVMVYPEIKIIPVGILCKVDKAGAAVLDNICNKLL